MSKDIFSLSQKVAIITGSGRETGIGAVIASTLAGRGAFVVINHVSEESAFRAAAVAQSIVDAGGKAVVVQADITTPAGAESLTRQTLEKFGVDHIDILVNNAAAGQPGPFFTASPSAIETIFRSVVFAPIYMIQSVMHHMPRGGRIVNIGSVASKLGLSPAAVYGAAKAAVDSLTFSLAMELGRGYGVTINTIMPGPVDTDALPKEVAERIHIALLPMTRAEERIGTANDIADAVLLICSEKSRWVTGQVISVSGGITGG